MTTPYEKKEVVGNPNPRIGSGCSSSETTFQKAVSVSKRGGKVGKKGSAVR